MLVRIQRSEILSFSAQEMFDLINDVKKYSDFVPFCSESEVLSASEDAIEARLSLAKGPLQRSFTTRNFLHQNDEFYRIELSLVEGPFKQFAGQWRIDDMEGHQCRVSLDINFDLKPGLRNFALKQMLELMANQLVDVFSKRAEQVYG